MLHIPNAVPPAFPQLGQDGAGILCVPSGSWGTVSHRCLLLSVTSGGAGMLCVPDGNGGLCPSTCAVLHHLCQNELRMLRVPGWDRGTQHRASVLCHLRAARAGMLRGPGGMCVRARVRGLFAIIPGAACGRARCQPQPGKGGAGAAGARSGERSPASGSGRGTGEVTPALGDTAALGTRGHGPAMARLLPVLLLAALGSAGRPGRRPAAWDGGADAQRPPARGCANLTLVLDNWKFAITSQLRNLLLSDHQSVLPDYGRIPALSGALDELYRDFRGLKEQLGRLSDRFAHLEASVEQLSRARGAAAPPRRGGVPQSPRRAPGTPQ
ncbi:uncharacterized protein LOC131585688 [Poecile atricapillus]|uniref:uncharacterized protein LOC131585688 n=1 Tax=Poecile atricapillus TaxID=48891 RepID=UPI00273942C6|nr:uncharacterized protein LOC131585688 [Poecile atricapillus]